MTVSASSARRFARRVRARRLSRLTVALCGLVLAGLLAGAAWVVWSSSLLGVSSVRVVGTSRVSVPQVLAIAGIETGTPLARLDPAAVAANVERLAAVRSAEVRRAWPRGVTIVVHERTPAAVRVRGSQFVLVDRSGVAFGTVGHRPPGLPLVSAPVDAGAPALRAALDALDAVPLPVRDQVKVVRAASADEVTLQLTRGRTVVWGGAERGRRKGAVLSVLLDRRAAVYDVSAPDTPTTRR